jgi:hypothetical protein
MTTEPTELDRLRELNQQNRTIITELALMRKCLEAIQRELEALHRDQNENTNKLLNNIYATT